MSCPICLEDVSNSSITLEPLICGHSFCSQCIRTWSNYSNECPLCRESVITGTLFSNISENPRRLNFKVVSPKGTSLDITDIELQTLKNIFGNLSPKSYDEFKNIDIDSKILVQNYNNNCWWYGNIVSIENNVFIIKDSIYIQRSNGYVYKSTPSVRSISYCQDDKFMIII